MCGIVGAVASRNIVPVLVEGLRRLEYRGYDSCGVAVHRDGLRRARSTSRVADLATQIEEDGLAGSTGISHTRWATHGAPVTTNAHPHFSRDEIAVVHNGIIENYEELRAELKAAGYVFETETDTEVIAHLVHSLYRGDLLAAVRQALETWPHCGLPKGPLATRSSSTADATTPDHRRQPMPPGRQRHYCS